VPSASELIVPLRGALVPVPAANQVGVCAICRSSAGPGYDTCFKCGQAAWLQPPDVVPITLSVDGGLIHRYLRQYKDGREPDKSRMALRLAALVAIFVANHTDCARRHLYDRERRVQHRKRAP
jgi:hypothetical protein